MLQFEGSISFSFTHNILPNKKSTFADFIIIISVVCPLFCSLSLIVTYGLGENLFLNPLNKDVIPEMGCNLSVVSQNGFFCSRGCFKLFKLNNST